MKKIKKRKRPSRKSLVRLADKLVSEYVRLRDKCCVTCGSTETLQCGHYLSRTRYSTRWRTDNCHAQCSRCNFLHEMNPVPYTEFMDATYGTSHRDALHVLWMQANPVSNDDLEKIIADMKRRIVEEGGTQ